MVGSWLVLGSFLVLGGSSLVPDFKFVPGLFVVTPCCFALLLGQFFVSASFVFGCGSWLLLAWFLVGSCLILVWFSLVAVGSVFGFWLVPEQLGIHLCTNEESLQDT